MAETHKTIADIIAWLRRPREGENAYLTLWRDEIADRLEAAHKREIEATAAKCCQLGRLAGYGASEIKHQQEPVGDAAKLREALLRCDAIAHFPEVRDYQSIKDMRNIIKHALAAPARNCDKYAKADEALKAQEQMFNDSNFANGECKLGCPECDNPRVGCKIAWLFAPATEQEGGAKWTNQ